MIDIGGVMMLAIAGGLAGLLGWSLRQLPQALLAWLLRLTTSTLEVRQPELVALLDRVVFERSGKRRQQIDRLTPRGTRAPADGWHFFRSRDRLIAAQRDHDTGGGSGGSELADLLVVPKVTLWCLGDIEPLDELIAEAERLEREDQLDKARSSYYTRRWDGWERHDGHHVGGMEHVVLREGMSQEIIRAAEQFFDGEDWYSTVGGNWAQGWLFEGPPGTGKSRTAWGIAQQLGVKLYILDIGVPDTDNSDIERLIRRMDPSSIVLLDDFDKTMAMLAEQGQKKGASQVTLPGILSALELPGAAGRLVIITVNKAELLDPDGTGALTRKGRIDRRWAFEAASEDQVARLLARFDGSLGDEERQAWIAAKTGRSTAEICSELLETFHPMSRRS